MATVPKSDRSTKITLASATAGPFDLDFRLFDQDGLLVTVNGDVSDDWTLHSHFRDGYDDSATITFASPLQAGDVIIIDSALRPHRAQDYRNSGGLITKLNIELGRLWAAVSDLYRDNRRSVRALQPIPPILLDAEKAGKTLVVDDAGTGFVLKDPVGGSPGAGGGDVTGPSSSKANNIPLFADETGKRLKDSGVALADLDGSVRSVKEYRFPHVLRTEIALGVLKDGDEFMMAGFRFKVDRSLDNNAKSWLTNMYGDYNYGVVCLDNLPLNLSVKPAFQTQDVNKLDLFLSADNVRWNRLNHYPMMRGGADSTIGGRDSQAFWNDRLKRWQLPVTSGTEQNTSENPYDFSTFLSPDLAAWGWQSGLLGTDGVRLKNVDRGQLPVTRQWSNRLYRFGGTQVIITSLEVLPKKPNPVNGQEGPALRPYIAECIDEENLIFGEPVMLSIGADNEPYLDPDVINWGSVFYAAIKNSSNRNIEIWSLPGTTIQDLKTGIWTKEATIDIGPDVGDWNSLEGPAWAPHKYVDPNDPNNVLVKFRLEVANNRDGDDRLIGVPRWTEAMHPAGPFDPLKQVENSHAQRNTTITNTGFINDPMAMATLLRAEAVYGGSGDGGITGGETLRAGTHNLFPHRGFEYTVHGEAGSTDVTIMEHVGDYFFLTVKNTNPNAYIRVVANEFARGVTIGAGRQETVMIIWSESTGKYIPLGRIADGGGDGDGVVNSASYQEISNLLTLGRTVGAPLPVDLGDLRESEPVVLLGLGQSNMDQNSTATGGVREVYPGIFVWDGTATSNGSAFSKAAFGSAPFNAGSANSQLLSAANLIKQTTGRDVYIILIAEGGRAIECFIKPATRTAYGWSAPANEITPFMYPQIATAIAAVPRRHRSVVDAVHFQHGEANGGDLAYSDKLVDGLISDLEDEGVFSPAHGYFAVGGLVPDNPDYAVHKAEVEAAEVLVPNLVYVNSVNLSDSGDNVHFDGESLLAMGNRCVVQGAILSGVFPVPVAKLEGDLRIILNEIGSRTWAIEKDGDLIFLPGDNSRNAGQIGQDSHRLARVVTDTVRMDAPSGSNHDLSMMENGILAMGGSPVGTKYDWKALGSISGALTLSSIGATRKAVFNMSGNVSLDITGMTDQTEIELNVLNSDAFDFSVSITTGSLMYANGVRPQDLSQQFAKVYIQREAGRYFVTCADYEVI